MKHVHNNEIRRRDTEHGPYFVIGTQVRRDLLTITDALKKAPKPDNYNNMDADALHSMVLWLEEGRDFNLNQLSKFFKMLNKFGLPDNLQGLAKQLDWLFGRPLTRSESFDIMQERRDLEKEQRTIGERKDTVTNYAFNQYHNLFADR